MTSVPSSGGLIPRGAARSEGSAASAVSTPSSAPPASNYESSESQPFTSGVDIPAGKGRLVTRETPVSSLPAPGKVRSEAAGAVLPVPDLASSEMILRIQRLAGGHIGIHRVK